MPEVEISIGGRYFEVACQAGEEQYLHAAARLLDAEASALTDQMGRLSEGRLLLMAGLMLADKTAGLDDRIRELEDKLATQETLIAELRQQPPIANGSSAALNKLVGKSETLANLIEKVVPVD